MTLLIGDATTTYTNADSTVAGEIVAALFTAAATGTVDQLQFRTNGTANTGVTSVILGIYADNGSGTNPTTSSAAIGQGTFSGTPAINSWIIVSGLSIPVTSGTKYWLAALPIAGSLNFNESVLSGGTNVTFSSTSAFTSLSTAAWSAATGPGPIGFQGLSTVVAATAVTIFSPAFLPQNLGPQAVGPTFFARQPLPGIPSIAPAATQFIAPNPYVINQSPKRASYY